MVHLDPVTRDGLADGAVTQIREAILEGRLERGTRLGENELSQTLGISRAPVREALLRLEQEGLVASARYRGKTVVALSGRDIDELVTLRSSLERLAWSRGCVNATDRDLTDLEDCVDQMRNAVGRRAYPELVRMDIEFHDRVVLAAGHARLYSAWSAIKWQVALYLLNRRVVADDYHQIIVAEHQQLITELRAADPQAAANAVEQHIGTAYERLKSGRYFDDPSGILENHEPSR